MRNMRFVGVCGRPRGSVVEVRDRPHRLSLWAPFLDATALVHGGPGNVVTPRCKQTRVQVRQANDFTGTIIFAQEL